MVCKKQEQCKLGKMCGWAEDEETLLTECVEFIERVPLTNEEYLKSCDTEQLAKVFGSMLFEAWKDGLAEEMHDKRFYEDLVDFWLKQTHTPFS